MSAILIRNIPEHVHDKLRARAKREGRSVEALAREALTALSEERPPSPEGLLARAARIQLALHIKSQGDAWSEAFDDPAFSREVLGLDRDPEPDDAPR